MFSLPVTRYHVDENKVNHSLQALYDTIVADLNKLANEGLQDEKLGDPCVNTILGCRVCVCVCVCVCFKKFCWLGSSV